MEPKDYSEEIDLSKYWMVLARRWLVISSVFLTCVGLAALAAFREKPVYEATGKLLIESDQVSSLTGVGEKIGELQALEFQGNPLNTQAVVIKSLSILEETISILDLKDGDGAPLDPEKLAARVEVEPILKTDVLDVSYKAEVPEQAAAVVNQIMKSYRASNLLANREQAVEAGKFIAEQLPRAKAQVDRASENLRQFKSENQIVELDQETRALVELVSELDTELGTARAELADIGTQSVELRRRLNLTPEAASDVVAVSQVPAVQDAFAQLQAVQSRLVVERARFTDTHPTILTLESQAAGLSNLVQERVAQVVGPNSQLTLGDLQAGAQRQSLATDLIKSDVQRAGLERRVATLAGLRQTYQQRTTNLPDLEKQQGELKQELKVAQTNYEDLLTKLQQIRIAENQNLGNARVIQTALVPRTTSGTSKRLYLAAGALAGLLLGIAAAFLIDLLDKSVKTVKEANALFGYTLLGLIPKFETDDGKSLQESSDRISPRIIVTDSPKSPIREAYQMLWANLRFVSSDKQNRTIVVTSSLPKEGKSEVTANLAAVIAQSGRRVLLVDADMRNPTQHHLWGLVNMVGLSNVIVGQGEFSQAVQSIDSNLAVLTAGVVPPNPLALIDSERMTSLIEMFSANYDYVVFDTPPLVGMADAAVLGKMVDGMLLVVQPGLVDSSSVAAAKALISRSGPNVLGIVANGVNLKHEPDSYFYHASPQVEQVSKVDSKRALAAVPAR